LEAQRNWLAQEAFRFHTAVLQWNARFHREFSSVAMTRAWDPVAEEGNRLLVTMPAATGGPFPEYVPEEDTEDEGGA
jgi:hypothetical protein